MFYTYQSKSSIEDKKCIRGCTDIFVCYNLWIRITKLVHNEIFLGQNILSNIKCLKL